MSRHQTQTERDLEGMKARKERNELAIPHEVTEQVTGVLKGVDLEIARAHRPTEERLKRLEWSRDELVAERAARAAWKRALILKVVAGALTVIAAYLAGRAG